VGKVELVTCKSVTRTVTGHGKRVKVKRQKCTINLVIGPVKFTTASASARATPSRGGVCTQPATATALAAGRARRSWRHERCGRGATS
jgi:hypothetical protein